MRPLILICFLSLFNSAAYAVDDAETTSPWQMNKGDITLNASDDVRIVIDGYAQIDGFLPLKPNSAQEDFELGRLRPIVKLEIGENFSFRLMTDLEDGRNDLQDAYGSYTFADAFELSAGKMKMPVGMEVNQSDTDLLFIQRSIVSSLLPSREYGLRASGNFADDRFSYSAGVFTNGAASEGPDHEDLKNRTYAARVLYSPFKGTETYFDNLLVGIGGDYGSRDSTPGRKRRTSPSTAAGGDMLTYLGGAQAQGDTWRISPQAEWSNGQFLLMTEYAFISSDTENIATGASDTLDFHAAQVSVGYVLTGEKATYGHLTPLNPWGAFALTGRLAYVDASDANDPRFTNTAASADSLTVGTAGLNWYVNDYVRLLFNYEYATFDGNVPEEQTVLTRLQLEF